MPLINMELKKEDIIPKGYKPKDNQSPAQAKIESIDVLDRIKVKIQKRREQVHVNKDLENTFPSEKN